MSEITHEAPAEAAAVIDKMPFWDRTKRAAAALLALSGGALISSESPATATTGYDTGGGMYVGSVEVRALCDDRDNLTPNLTGVYLVNSGSDPTPVSGTLHIGNETEQVHNLRNGGFDTFHAIKRMTKSDGQRISFTDNRGQSNSFISGCRYNPNAPQTTDGYWMLDTGGRVFEFGIASRYNDGNKLPGKFVDIEGMGSARGYWVVNSIGEIAAGGAAVEFGERPALNAGEEVTSMSSTLSDNGYWLFTNKGRVIPYGDARHFGDMSGVKLNGPVLDSIPTPSGQGYYMVASDGGVFTFGDAAFKGSMGDKRLNAPVQSLVPDADNIGYWLVASDGGIFSFDASFYGSMGSTKLNKPVTGMVPGPGGRGYLMVAEDGGIFTFGEVKFRGSLGSTPLLYPISSVAAFEKQS